MLVKCPNCHAEVRVRTCLGDFELLNILGEGGSGRVFRARRRAPLESESSPEIALKVLEHSHPDYQENLQFLKNEARFAQLMNHPRVVQVLALEEGEFGAILLMEWMKGGSLHDRMIAEGSLGEQQVLESGFEILKALSAAYAKGIIHRDLKPANILFKSSGGAKLGDFGLACFVTPESKHSSELPLENLLMATPDYVAPEILAGETGDFQSDVYGLGGALYHALTGQAPYVTEGRTLEELQVLKSNRVALDCSIRNLHPQTASLITRMLDPDPKARFSSYAELEGAFQVALESVEHSIKKSSRTGNLLRLIRGFFTPRGKTVSVRS